jgi:ribose transport system substrate-binding protein
MKLTTVSSLLFPFLFFASACEGEKPGPKASPADPGNTTPSKSGGGEGTKSPEIETRKRPVFKVPEGTPLKLAFVTNNASEFWKIAEKGLQRAKQEKGIQVDLKQPDTGKVEQQKKILEDLVSQGYHGIAVSVISAEDMVRDINKAAEQLNIITHDSDAPKSNRLVYIGTNNYEAGQVLGREIVKVLPDGGKVGVFVGTIAADNARQRYKGVQDETRKNPKIQLMQPKEDNKDLNKARTNVEDVINANPDVKLLVGLWSYNGPAIVSAVKASGRQKDLKIACFDEEVETLEGIEEGLIACTVVQKPFEFGYQSAVLLQELCLKGEAALPKSDVIDTGVDVISQQNVAAFKKKLADLKK